MRMPTSPTLIRGSMLLSCGTLAYLASTLTALFVVVCWISGKSLAVARVASGVTTGDALGAANSGVVRSRVPGRASQLRRMRVISEGRQGTATLQRVSAGKIARVAGV
jgi:hypothetical protein